MLKMFVDRGIITNSTQSPTEILVHTNNVNLNYRNLVYGQKLIVVAVGTTILQFMRTKVMG